VSEYHKNQKSLWRYIRIIELWFLVENTGQFDIIDLSQDNNPLFVSVSGTIYYQLGMKRPEE